MKLDIENKGLSWGLINFGIHEETSTAVMGSELETLLETVSGKITVLEAGANFGYYALVEASVLGDRGKYSRLNPVLLQQSY